MKPFLLVLSSPSGGGKTTIARQLLMARDDLGYSVSATTRERRTGETDGVDYYFLPREEFLRREAAGDFLETATYGGELYGTLRSEIDRLFAAGKTVVLDIEIKGAKQIRGQMPDAVEIFVLPPSASVLVSRLAGRATEVPAVLRERMARAADELKAVTEYDYVVVNEDLFAAVAQVAAILDAESRRVSRQDDLGALVEQLRRDVIEETARFSAHHSAQKP
ncbi:MAG TPA: guanylate kinase [Gemmatimonadales bacterium]|nr:guanylate kinase [Gemmatimonadales bacterium]